MASLNEFEYERTVRGIVERIAYQLGDAEAGDEYSGYDEKWIAARVYDTFKWLQGRRPTLFANEVEFELCQGDRQDVPDECDKLLEILSVLIDGEEFPAYAVSYMALQGARVYDKLLNCPSKPCRYDYGISEIDPRSFRISPAIVSNEPVKVRATCSDMNRYFDDPDETIECDVAKWINTVVEYVLFQAHSMDSENPTSESMAERHRATFFELAPVQRREQA
jgi:hypothetical protein